MVIKWDTHGYQTALNLRKFALLPSRWSIFKIAPWDAEKKLYSLYSFLSVWNVLYMSVMSICFKTSITFCYSLIHFCKWVFSFLFNRLYHFHNVMCTVYYLYAFWNGVFKCSWCIFAGFWCYYAVFQTVGGILVSTPRHLFFQMHCRKTELLEQDLGHLLAIDLAGCRLSGTKTLMQLLPSPLCPHSVWPSVPKEADLVDPMTTQMERGP